MALKIRLSRAGAKKHPYYRIVVADSRSPRDGRFVEKIGNYAPLLPHDHPQRLVLNAERAQYWLKAGAQPSDRVVGFLAKLGLATAPARRDQSKQHMPKAKAQERMKAAEAAKASADAPAEAS